jgi:prepilin signal peptidase PulO-like enzyme (type II secretory pathway)
VLDQRTGLAVALAAVWASCLAILHKTWTLRRGWVQAVRYLVASVVRHRTWPVPAVLGGLLSLLVLATWSLGTARWESLCSSMIGLCFAGGLIWSVRIIGGHTLRVEAMGFGDVTLLAMIGAFLGWQASFLVFFLAPFTALLVAATQWLITGERRIAFGPYLCLAAVIVLVAWDPIWTEWASLMFSLPWFIPLVLVGCLAVMGGLLWFWRLVRDAFF